MLCRIERIVRPSAVSTCKPPSIDASPIVFESFLPLAGTRWTRHLARGATGLTQVRRFSPHDLLVWLCSEGRPPDWLSTILTADAERRSSDLRSQFLGELKLPIPKHLR